MTKESYNFGVDTEAKQLYTETSGMTDKRFRSDGKVIYDGKYHISLIQASKTLNELYNENQKLKNEIEELEKFRYFVFQKLTEIYEDKE